MPRSLGLQDAGPFETFINTIIRMLGWAEGLYMTSDNVCRCKELQLSFLSLCHQYPKLTINSSSFVVLCLLARPHAMMYPIYAIPF